MKSDKNSSFQTEDAEIRRLLRKNDPAGAILPDVCDRLKSLVTERAIHQPQLGSYAEAISPFALPGILGGPLSWWPMAIGGTMMAGLFLGLFISSVVESPVQAYRTAQNYTITTAMNEPWRQLAP